jgi:hypothetical protein
MDGNEVDGLCSRHNVESALQLWEARYGLVASYINRYGKFRFDLGDDLAPSGLRPLRFD